MYRLNTIGRDTRRALVALLLALGVGAPAWAAAPFVASPIGTVNANEDDPTVQIDLNGVFSDPEGQPMTYAVVSNDNATIVSANVVGNFLELTFAPNQNGLANISVEATDDEGLTATDSFTLDLAAQNDAPTIVGAVPVAVSAAEDSGPLAVALSSVVDDVDIAIEGDTLTWKVQNNSNSTLVTSASFSGSTLNMTLGANRSGSATITVRVEDLKGARVEFDVNLTVTPVNDAPVAVASPSATYNEDTGGHTISMSGVFTDVDGPSSTLSVIGITNSGLFAAGGAPSISGGINLGFTLATNANGTSVVTVRDSDGAGGTATTTVTINVTALNDAPTVTSPMLDRSRAEDGLPIVVNLATVFTDPDIATNGDSLTFTATSSNTSKATVSVSGSTLTVTLVPNANGTATIAVQARDTAAATASDDFILTITPVNDAPTVVSPLSDATATEDGANVVVNLAPVFADVDIATNGDSLTYTATSSNTSRATVSVSGSTLTVALVPNGNGTATITVQARDTAAATASDDFILTITPVNDAPTVASPLPDRTVAEDSPDGVFSLAGVFADVDIATNGDSLTYAVSANSNPALISVTTSGSTMTLHLLPNQYGSASISVRATDLAGANVTSSFTVTVTPVNDAPVVVAPPAPVTIAEDAGAQTVSLAGVFADVDGDALTLSVTGASNAGLFSSGPTVSGTNLTFTTAANANGASTITVQARDPSNATVTTTVNLTVTPVNDAPTVAAAPAPVSVAEDAGPQTVSLAGVFTDVDGDPLTLTVTSASNPGLFSVAPAVSGTNLTFTSAPNANGASTITVEARDPSNTTVTTTVSLTVTPVNDAPTVVGAAGPVTVDEDAGPQAVSLAGVFNDIDAGDTLTLSVVTVTNPGLFASPPTITGTTLNLSFAPNQNGTSAITFRATDSKGATATTGLTVIVNPVNDAPTVANPMPDRTVAEDSADIVIDLANVFADVDIATNSDVLTFVVTTNTNTSLVTATISGSTLTVHLLPDQNGAATITVSATDTSAASVTDSFDLTVTPVNDLPVASDDSATMDEDTGPLSIAVLGNDYLAETPTIISAAGTTQVIGGVSYPGSSNSTPTSMPTATGTAVTLPNGAVVINGNNIEYTPKANFNGTDFFTYTIRDSNGDESTATVTITINAVNDAPQAGSVAHYTIAQGQVLQILPDGGLVSHAFDPESDPVTVAQETAPDSIASGYPGTTLNLQPDGSFTYTPDVSFTGSDRFTVRYTDGALLSSIVEVFVDVTPAAPPPPPPPPGEVEFDFQLANVPLEEAISAEANVLVVMDDSGSMDWTVLTPGPEGEFRITNANTKDRTVATATKDFDYVIPAPTNVYGNTAVVPTEAALAASTDFTGNDYGVWRARSAQYNPVYYNPKVRYKPWVGLNRNNVDFANANPTAAPYDPYDPVIQTINLTTPLTYTSNAVPKTRNGGSGSTKNVSNSNVYLPQYYTTTATGAPAWNDPHTLVEIRNNGTIYAGGPDRDDCAADDGNPSTCTYAQEIQNFANWFTYYRSREYTAKAGLGRAVADASNIRIGYVVLNDANERLQLAALNASYRVGQKKAMLNQIYKIDSNNGTPLRVALDKAGKYFSCKAGDSFGSTTNRLPGDPTCPALPSPEGQCQNNFALLFTDGYWNESFSLRGNDDGPYPTGDTLFDGGKYADNVSRTLADVAMYYYERDLQPSLANAVPTTEVDRNGAPASAFGNQGMTMQQHMSTFTIGFGVKGKIDPATVPTDYRVAFNWGNPFNSDAEKADDLLHAAVNGRGKYLSANNPVLLSAAFQEAFAAFSNGSVSVSAVAFNSTALREETVEYRGFFNLKYNTGDLRALKVDPTNGTVDNLNPLWRAAQTMDTKAATNRVIYTLDRVNDVGKPFRYANLNGNQTAQLSLDETNYLRGDRSKEEPAGNFRARPLVEGLLGDIVHSAPQFVGAPRAIRRDQPPYPTQSGQLYSAFKAAQASRTPLVYVAANDGMVHGFNATTGDEMMGYVPNKLIDSTERFNNDLDLLTSLTYAHRFFVDVTPTVEDVYVRPSKTALSKAWTSVMVGALGGGGKGYYSLNVSTPQTSFTSEANAAGTALWEFTDKDDTYPVDALGNPLGGAVGAITDLSGQPVKDLGYTYSPAQIAMTNVGDGGTPPQKKWMAFFGNGYNSTAGIAKLFALSINDGIDGWSSGDFVKLSTGEGVKAAPDALAGLPNGLGTPALIDKDLNGTVDYIYAGDLFGYLYRFDVTDANPANWKVTKIFQATYGSGASAVRQPITTQPFVMKHPSGTGYLVVIGTGSWVTDPDGVSHEIQSVYGIWDRLDVNPPTALANAKSTRLVGQTITNIVDETTFAFERLRFASNNPVNYVPDSGATPGVYGWYFNLDMVRPTQTVQGHVNPDTTGQAPPLPQFPGERAIRRFVPRGSALLVTTVIPRDNNTCTRSPPGSTFPIDPITGGTPKKPILDLNNDGKIDDSDMVTIGGQAYAAGILFDTNDLNGTLVDPSLLLGSGSTDFLFLSGGDEQITLRIAGAEDPKTGRLSWRELDDVN